jgi:hypothetical protein
MSDSAVEDVEKLNRSSDQDCHTAQEGGEDEFAGAHMLAIIRFSATDHEYDGTLPTIACREAKSPLPFDGHSAWRRLRQ